MSKVRLEVEIPDEIAGTQLEQKFLAAAQQLIQEQTVVRLFEQGDVSSGYAADLLGMSRHDFIQLLANRGVSFFNYKPEELRQEIENAERAYTSSDAERTNHP